MSKERIVASLDIGSAKIRTVVAVVDGDQEKLIPNVIGVGLSPPMACARGT
jgi:cell division ATPase FtsA